LKFQVLDLAKAELAHKLQGPGHRNNLETAIPFLRGRT
jgi:hypothetical protein